MSGEPDTFNSCSYGPERLELTEPNVLGLSFPLAWESSISFMSLNHSLAIQLTTCEAMSGCFSCSR